MEPCLLYFAYLVERIVESVGLFVLEILYLHAYMSRSFVEFKR